MKLFSGFERVSSRLPRWLGLGVAVCCVLVLGGSMACAQTAAPTLQRWVTDPQHVLSADEEAALSQKLFTLSQSLPGNPQIAIDMPGHVDDIDAYANETFQNTGLGRKGHDNGVLIILAVESRQSRIEVGYGLEGVLTDLQSNDLLRAARPALKAGQYANALNGILDGMAALLKNAEDTSPQSPVDATTDAWEGLTGLVVVILLFVVLPLYLIRRARRQKLQNPGFADPQAQQERSATWGFWLNLILNILSAFLQGGGRGGGGSGGSSSGGSFRAGGGSSGGGGSRDSW